MSKTDVKIVFKKFISRGINNDIETVSHYRKEGLLPVDIYEALTETFDDWDSARYNGVQYDDDDNWYISIRQMLEYLEEHIVELKDDGKVDEEDADSEYEWESQINREQKIVDYFKKWIDWDAII